VFPCVLCNYKQIVFTIPVSGTKKIYSALRLCIRRYIINYMFVHTGKVFAILAAADNAVPLLSGVLYTQVYNATITSAPSTIFWVTFASQICVFILIL